MYLLQYLNRQFNMNHSNVNLRQASQRLDININDTKCLKRQTLQE
jgi:hypothetical protein